MNNFRVGGSRFSRFMNGKGFYIALALCLIAIGSAAYIAANSSIGMISGNNTAGSSKTSGAKAAQSAFVWDNASEAEQTNRTVSGVPYTASSSVNSLASGTSSVQGLTIISFMIQYSNIYICRRKEQAYAEHRYEYFTRLTQKPM